MYMLGLGQGVKSPGISGGIGNGVGMGMARSVSAGGPVAAHSGSFKSSVHGSLAMSRRVSEPVKSVGGVQEIMDEEEEEESEEENEDTDVDVD
ncbi:hypothetical protein CPC08DRAFT_771555 [Agrocybe pediades]|nr:hypothetical protein CPC08DRAFT_771555 [Agrocybe pediades]